jgi:soluble lytic murein transglycosylase-like protein
MIYRNVAPQIRMPKNVTRRCPNCLRNHLTDRATWICKECKAKQRRAVQADAAPTPSRRMSRRVLHISAVMLLLSTPALRAAVTPPHIPAVIQIESSNNPLAHNQSSGARGLLQITPIVLEEWNQHHPSNQFTLRDLFTPSVNRLIGTWYLTKRLPRLIGSRHPTDLLIGFNYGPAAFNRWRTKHRARYSRLPSETRNYLRRYDRLTRSTVATLVRRPAAKTRITKKPRYTTLTKKGRARNGSRRPS